MGNHKLRIRQLFPLAVVLFTALVALPVQAAGGLCLNVASYAGTYNYNVNSGKLNSPNVDILENAQLGGLDKFFPTSAIHWSGSRAASLDIVTSQDNPLALLQLSIFDLNTGKSIMLNDGSAPENGIYEFYGWSADGKYLAAVVAGTVEAELRFYSVSPLKRVKSSTWGLSTQIGIYNKGLISHWSPQGHTFVDSIVFPDTQSIDLNIWSPDRDNFTTTWHNTVRYLGGPLTIHWSPDGRYLAVHDDTTLRVYGIDGKVYFTDAIVPSSFNYYSGTVTDSPVWSSDGKTLLFAKPYELHGDTGVECPGASLIAYSSTDQSKKTIAENFFLPIMYSSDLHYAVLTFTDSDIPCTSGGAPSFPVTYRMLDVQKATLSDVIFSSDTNMFYHHASWSPDNQMVALIHYDELILSSGDGHNIHVIDPVFSPTYDYISDKLRWSANSEWVVYPSQRISVKTGEVSDLGLDANDVYPSPEGSAVAAYVKKTLSIVSNNKIYKVNDDVGAVELFQYPPSWSPDGLLVAYLASENDNQVVFHVAKVDGSELFKSPVKFLKDNPFQWSVCE